MSSFKKLTSLLICCVGVVACNGNANGTTGGVTPGPTPSSVAGINIGNISAIPVTGNQTSTALVVTNNSGFNATLTSAGITQNSAVTPLSISSANDSTSFGLVNISQCATLQAAGTCSVAVTPPAKSGSYLLTMNYTTGSTSYTTSQVVTYSNTIPPAGGFTYSNLNNNLYLPPNGSTTYAIPFVLDNAYASLYAYSNNPAFATRFSCPGGSTYSQGDLCTAYVTVSGLGSNPSVIANVTVSTIPNPNAILPQKLPKSTVKSNSVKIAGTPGYSFNTQVSVINNVSGNIVSSAFNIVVNNATSPVTSGSAQTVTLLNNGSATVSGITITPVGGIITIINTGAGSCGAASNSLTAGSSCTFTVNANTSTSGSGTVNVTYNNGGSGNTNGSTPFTVVYIATASVPGMSMTSGQGSLLNAVVGITSNLNILVTNTGNAALTNISFTPASDFGSQFAYDTVNSTCSTAGSQSLAIGASCTLILQYTPTAAHASTSITVSEKASYTDVNDNILTYAGSSFTTSYSAFNSNAFVYLTPNYVSYAIRANNTDTATQTITVVNYGGQPATLSTPSYTLSSGLTGIASTIHVTDNCAGFTLTANSAATCTIVIVYGSVAESVVPTSGYLDVAYLPNAAATAVTAFSGQSFQAQTAALVGVSAAVQTGATTYSPQGSGTSVSPYQFYNSSFSGSPIILTYTYTNSGTAAANNFIVNLDNLPLGWIVSGSPTCGYGVSSTTLAASGTCTVAVKAIGSGSFWNQFAWNSAINVVTPHFTYDDTNTGFNSGPASPATTYVTPVLFAAVSGSGGTSSTATAGGNFNITFTATSGDVTNEYPAQITIPATSLPVGSGTPIYLTTSDTCNITNATGSNTCTINVTNIAGAVPATYTYQYWVTPTGLTPSASNSVINYFTFTLN